MDILVTAFTPFGNFTENKSAEVLSLLSGKYQTLLLPTSYERSFRLLKEYIEKYPVWAVALLVQAPREKITVERVAINIADCSLADNDGTVLTDTPLVPDAPAAYFSTLPIKAMLRAADCAVSNTAGVYVCNALMYKALHFFAGSGVLCGFVHIPQSGDAHILAAELQKILAAV